MGVRFGRSITAPAAREAVMRGSCARSRTSTKRDEDEEGQRPQLGFAFRARDSAGMNACLRHHGKRVLPIDLDFETREHAGIAERVARWGCPMGSDQSSSRCVPVRAFVNARAIVLECEPLIARGKKRGHEARVGSSGVRRAVILQERARARLDEVAAVALVESRGARHCSNASERKTNVLHVVSLLCRS